LTRKIEWILIGAVALAAAAAGFSYNAWRTVPESHPQHGEPSAMALTLADLDGKPQPLEQWRGKVVVVNFWATWCAPCREEIPILIRLQEKYGERGLQLVGIAIDQPDKVRPYAREMRMNFPILIGELEAINLTRAWGNRAGVLPFTVVLGRDGKIASREVGVVKEAKIEPLLSSLLGEVRATSAN
jgi:thiol-disulfide isomerase/thioredoxin